MPQMMRMKNPSGSKIHMKYTEEEQKVLLSKVVQVALEATFSNHIYQYQNNLYRQSKGGGIGARITGVVARVVMDLWMDLIQQNLKENGIKIYLLTKYVDGINVATSLISKGKEWVKEGSH